MLHGELPGFAGACIAMPGSSESPSRIQPEANDNPMRLLGSIIAAGAELRREMS